jgi:hypothetical protein
MGGAEAHQIAILFLFVLLGTLFHCPTRTGTMALLHEMYSRADSFRWVDSACEEAIRD